MENRIYKIKGELSHILFPKEGQLDETSFKIASFIVSEIIDQPTDEFRVGDKYSIKGNMPKLSTSDEYVLYIKITGKHPQYGNQYEIVYINTSYDIKSNHDAKKFLKRILSDSQYDSVIKEIDSPLDVIANGDIDKLINIKGIGESTARNILNKYNKSKDYASIYVALEAYGLTDNTIEKLIKKFKSAQKVIESVKNDIYVLSEIDGFGFLKADDYFIKGGGLPNSPKRINAYIRYYLKEESQNGNSWVNSNLFAREIYRVFGEDLDRSVFGAVLKEMEERKVIKYDREKKRIGLMSMYNLEIAIASEIKRLLGGNRLTYRNDWKNVIGDIENGQGWEYTETQKRGIVTILDNQFVLVTGLGGTGKSSLLKAVTTIYAGKYETIQCALSGCASQRMNQVSGNDAATIHKTLEYNPAKGFQKNESNQLSTKVVILDEASMVSGDLFLRLLQATPTGAKFIVLGDYGQLESIGVCNVFFDLLQSDIPVVKLTEVHRQAKASAITSKSIEIRDSKQLFDAKFRGRTILGDLQDLELNIDNKDMLQKYAIKQYLHHANKSGVINVMGVAPMRDRGNLSCYALNTAIQSKLALKRDVSMTRNMGKDKKYIFYVGDKVINTKNNYKTVDSLGNETPIFNGNIGIIKNIYSDKMIVRFTGVGDICIDRSDIDQIELAYFITVHKSQGSEADTVIVAMDYSAYTMLSNELLYTAITRAKSYCVLVGENSAIRKAINTFSTTTKNTYLKELLSNK